MTMCDNISSQAIKTRGQFIWPTNDEPPGMRINDYCREKWSHSTRNNCTLYKVRCAIVQFILRKRRRFSLWSLQPQIVIKGIGETVDRVMRLCVTRASCVDLNWTTFDQRAILQTVAWLDRPVACTQVCLAEKVCSLAIKILVYIMSNIWTFWNLFISVFSHCVE